MFKIHISGYGAEVTQGALPIETVEQIYDELGDGDLSRYISDCQFEDDKLDWFEVDSNFHTTGAYVTESTIYVTDEADNLIYQEECCNLTVFANDYTEDIYPEDSKVGPIGVLTCYEIQKGWFHTGDLNTEEFNPELLSIEVKSLGDLDIVSTILYDGMELDAADFGDTTTKDFIAELEN
jgi:hypothetical protein